jgi:uncharacterized protein YfeS
VIKKTAEQLKTLCLNQDKYGDTAWTLAVQRSKAEVLDKLREFAKEVLNRDELNNKLLLAKDEGENTVLPYS